MLTNNRPRILVLVFLLSYHIPTYISKTLFCSRNDKAPRTRKVLKIGNLNIVSITKHFTELQVIMDSHQFDNLGLNETRLGKETLDSEIRIDGYDIERTEMRVEVVLPFMLTDIYLISSAMI